MPTLRAVTPARAASGENAPAYFVGAHRPHWLAASTLSLFVSHRTLRGRKSLPRALAPWALDSGGFSELSLYGEWRTSPREYACAVRRYRDEIGNLVFASQQDWMCEPAILERTRLSVTEHQTRTIDNYLELMRLAPELPWLPVVQGWTLGCYLDHVEMWAQRGVDLSKLPRVGVGSICRRQSTLRAHLILGAVHAAGIKTHAFGLKLTGLEACGGWLASADSMAWSYAARRENRTDGWLLRGRKTGSQNQLATACEWFELRVKPLLERGFCVQTGMSVQPTRPHEHPFAATLQNS